MLVSRTHVRIRTTTYLVLALASSPLAPRYRLAKSETVLSLTLKIFLLRYAVVERFGADARWQGAQQGGLDL